MFSSEDVMTSEVVCPLTRFQMYGIWRYIIQHLYMVSGAWMFCLSRPIQRDKVTLGTCSALYDFFSWFLPLSQGHG